MMKRNGLVAAMILGVAGTTLVMGCEEKKAPAPAKPSQPAPPAATGSTGATTPAAPK